MCLYLKTWAYGTGAVVHMVHGIISGLACEIVGVVSSTLAITSTWKVSKLFCFSTTIGPLFPCCVGPTLCPTSGCPSSCSA